MEIKVFEFDLIENKFVIGLNYKGIGKRYLNGTICLAPFDPYGILILSLNKGVSEGEPIELSNLHLYPNETEAIKSNINKHIKTMESMEDEETLKDINNFFKELRNGNTSNK